MNFAVIKNGLFIVLAVTSLAGHAFTRVRRVTELKEQDPAAIIARAPESAQVTLPVRYYRGQEAEIGSLESITNALTLGQLMLQRELREAGALYTIATNDLASARSERDWYHAEYDRASAAAAAAEARAARLDALREWLIARRDAVPLSPTKVIYQDIIDRIDNYGNQ